MNTWFRYHVSAICLALAQFRRSPGHFFFNILVLSMTLALPFGGITLLDNIQSVTGQLSVSPEISLFLKQNTERADAQAMEQSIRQLLRKDNIAADIIFIPKEAALDSLEEKTGLNDMAGPLGKNPLPDSYIIRLSDNMPDGTTLSARIDAITSQLQKLPETDKVQIDSDWTKRLAALLGVMRMGLVFLGGVLCSVLMCCTFNTIRLQVLMHLDEITLSWHVGANRAYIRRPFCYMGIFLGLFSGCLALILVGLSLYPFNSAINELAQLYGSDFRLSPLNPGTSVILLLASAALGWLGALLSVNRQLRKIY